MVIKVADFGARAIRIEPTTAVSVGSKVEEVTFDLHVGASYKVPGDANPKALDRSLALSAGECLRVTTRERVQLPADVFGQICSKASLSAEGLMVANTKVDPTFNDFLDIAVFNTSATPLRLQRDEPFCSVFFQELSGRVAQSNVSICRPHPRPRPSRPIPDFLLKYRAYVITAAITFALSVTASVVANHITGTGSAPASPPHKEGVNGVPKTGLEQK